VVESVGDGYVLPVGPGLLPTIPPTGRRGEIPIVAVVGVRAGRIDDEHIYWDQASVLAQVGLIDLATLPALGVDQSQVLVDGDAPLNAHVRAGRR
jgi:carboxymethylenebutenolidase